MGSITCDLVLKHEVLWQCLPTADRKVNTWKYSLSVFQNFQVLSFETDAILKLNISNKRSKISYHIINNDIVKMLKIHIISTFRLLTDCHTD